MAKCYKIVNRGVEQGVIKFQGTCRMGAYLNMFHVVLKLVRNRMKSHDSFQGVNAKNLGSGNGCYGIGEASFEIFYHVISQRGSQQRVTSDVSGCLTTRLQFMYRTFILRPTDFELLAY